MNDHTTPQSSVKLCECGCGQPAPIATQTDTKYDAVKGQPRRYVHGHHTRIPADQRFWTKVNVCGPDDCWEWQANRYINGYGCFFAKRGSSVPAHRFAYILTHGP